MESIYANLVLQAGQLELKSRGRVRFSKDLSVSSGEKFIVLSNPEDSAQLG